MRIGSLFSGIDGLGEGLEAAGVGSVVWHVERDEHCRRVLSRLWPEARQYDDVCTVGAHNLAPVDVVAGGFPCQDISYAGPGAGLDGARSGLWFEMARIIGEMGPRYAIVENVPALFTRGFDVVLGTLADLGYDAEWSDLSACAVGASHVRRRLFVVAYANSLNGRSRVRHSPAQPFRPVQAVGGFESARAGWRARLADPSALYGNADGVPAGSERNRAIGNSVVPQVAQAVGEILLQIDAELSGDA